MAALEGRLKLRHTVDTGHVAECERVRADLRTEFAIRSRIVLLRQAKRTPRMSRS